MTPSWQPRSYRPAVLAWLGWLGKDPARATAKDAAAYDRDTESTIAAALGVDPVSILTVEGNHANN